MHYNWVGVVGVMLGRDDAAVRAAATGNHDTLLRQLQLDEKPLQTTMTLLRRSMGRR